MLRVVAHQSAAAARKYYSEGLRREDYYSEGQEVVGKWHGKAATRLGLRGDVTPEAFAALVENRHPRTGERLTPRTKENRRVGYDFNFNAPKCLSVLHALTGDTDVLAAFRAAVKETMSELEERAAARMRRGGAKGNRTTGYLAWAEFIHFTARPVGGIPDPHLHIHCFAFNATFDGVEDRWKAAQFGDIKRDAPYAEAAFHARLTAKLAALGYGIRRTRHGWEVAGVPSSVIDKFSRRTAQIERYAEEHGIIDAKTKDGLGAATREGKRHCLSYIDLLAAWSVRLTPEEKAAVAKVRFDREAHPPRKTITAKMALDFAIEKLFAKDSVVEQRRLVAEALRYGVGQVKPEQLWRELSRREMIVGKRGGEICCTTLDVLAEEVALIDFVRSGRGRCAPLQAGSLRFGNTKLSGEQRAAVRHILSTNDQVIAIRGAAGVGKTTLMKEVAAQIEAGGHKLFAFAPSAAASRETLREEGFAGADTVAHLLLNKNLQQQVRGQVIWIDEAGLLGSREMGEVMKLAADGRTRIILTGDSNQHAPVARGDAFRLLQKYAGLPIAEVQDIRRQEHAIYKRAVSALSRGDLPSAFGDLDRLEAILEVPDDAARYRMLAADFVDLSRKGSVPLVVSPTHAESAKVTEAIRAARRDAGHLKAERSLIRYHNLQWENADKKRAENYREGLLVQFHQNAKGIRRGALFRILAAGDGSEQPMMRNAAGREIAVPLNVVERFQVFEPREITVGKGDLIRITNNGQSADGKRLNNGNVFAIEKFKKNGNIVLANGAELKPDHGHFTHGYCQTSHSSQSKSVRDVLVAQSADSFVASSREQFYVSVSRGKQSIRIYTDDRHALQEAVGHTSARHSALELAGLKKRDLSIMSEALNSKQWRDAVRSRLAEGEQNTHARNLAKERKQDPNKKGEGMTWRQYVEMRQGLVGPDGRSRSKGHPQPKEKKTGDVASKGRSFARPTELTTPTTERLKKAQEAKQQGAAPAKPKGTAQQNTRRARLTNAFQSAAKHFSNIMKRREAKAAQPAAQEAQPAMKAELRKNKDVTPPKAPVPVSDPAMRMNRRDLIIHETRTQHHIAQARLNASLPQSNIQQVSDHAVRQKAAEAGKAQQEAAKLAQQPKQQPKPPTPPPPAPRK